MVVLKHLRANVVAYLALFIALGGTSAYAAEKIKSSQIANKAVKSKHLANNSVKAKHVANNSVRAPNIRANAVTARQLRPGSVLTGHIVDGQVKPQDTNFIHYARETEPVTLGAGETALLTNVVEHLPRRGDLVSIHGRVDITRSGTGGDCTVLLRLESSGASTTEVAVKADPGTDRIYFSGPGPGTLSEIEAAPITIPVVDSPYVTAELRAESEATTCEFGERNLFLQLIR